MWTLVIFIYAGTFAKGDSVALLEVPNFVTENACVKAAEKVKPFVSGTAKELKYVCLKKD